MAKRILCVLLGLGLLVPALAASQAREEVAPHPETGSVQTVEEGLRADVEAYASENRITIDEAVKRLSLRPELSETVETLRSDHSDVLAGIWLEHDPEYRLVIRTTRPQREINALVSKLPISVEIQTDAKMSLEATLSALESNTASLEKAVPGLDGMDVDERTGEIVLFVAGVAEGNRSLPAEVASELLHVETGIHVRVETHPEASSDGHTYGGNDTTSCTAGFVVKNAAGTRGYTTSGHCGNAQTFFEFGGGSYDTDFVAQVRNNTTDLQWGTTPHFEYGQFYANSTTSRRVLTGQRLRSNSIVGDVVCHRGSTSGYSCGNITSVTFRPTYTNACPGSGGCSAVWLRVEGTGLDCQPGDSGGPVFFNNDAYGFYKGQNRTDGNCNRMYVMSSTYLGNLGVTYLYG